jgi:hypothetical protein
MYDPLYDVGFTIFAVVFCAWWWFIAKDSATRKYIISLGICWVVAGTSHMVIKSFDIPSLTGLLSLIGLLALCGSIYFLIKAALSERKAKKKSPHD